LFLAALASAVCSISLTAVPAGAAVIEQQWISCTGDEVRSCIWINYDTTNDRLRGYAKIWDVTGRHNYDVAAYWVMVEEDVGPPFGWVGDQIHDNDGWMVTRDTIASGLHTCRGGPLKEYYYRVVASFAWSDPVTNSIIGTRKMTGKTLRCNRNSDGVY
jgi:hypothetical protein